MPDTDRDCPLDIRTEGGEVTIVCTGAMDLHNSKPFRAALLEAATSADSVTVDFRAVVYIDTAVLAHLVLGANKMRSRDKRLKLLLKGGTHPRRTIEMTGFEAVLDVIVDEPDAAQ